MNPVSVSSMNKDEELVFQLRSMYERYGYTQYKMSRFEEYDLYAGNKDFLMSDNVITFTDTNGKLMALKPDVTLSIVRNSRFDPDDLVRKVYYHENVYRVSGRNHNFCEIMQTGLECIGNIDSYCVSEVLMLAASSLRCISSECVLNLSHMAVVGYFIDRLRLPEATRAKVFKCIGEKNTHELESICAEGHADTLALQALLKLITLTGKPSEVAPILSGLGCPEEYIRELTDLEKDLACFSLDDLLRINFSVVNDMSYYNGLVFKGYVQGIPTSVLSGGRYDSLMQKIGRNTGAIGFAVYPDLLEKYWNETSEYDVDTLLLYDDSVSHDQLFSAVNELNSTGASTLAVRTVPSSIRYRQLATFSGSEVKIIENNA